MLQRQSHAPATVYALADHLDSTLAACEDLLELNGRHADLEWFLASVRRFELAAILQVLRVRQFAEELRGTDPRIAAVAALFLAGTVAFTEASGAQVNSPFNGDTDGAADRGGLAITDQYMIGRRVPIGVLAEVVGAFLDTLEVAYVLYDAGEPRALRSRPGVAVRPPGPPPLPVPPFASVGAGVGVGVGAGVGQVPQP